MSTVGSPVWEVVGTSVMSQLNPALGCDVHDVDILATGSARAILAIPAEGQELPIRGPARRNGVTAISQALNVCTVLVHGVNLRQSGASAYPCKLGIGAWVPGWRYVWSGKV